MSNTNDFASKDLTAGQLNAIVKKLGGHDAALRFLRGELTVSEAAPLTDGIWQTPAQAAGGSCTLGELLDAAPKGETRTIDWYLEDPENRIPEEWDGKVIFFRNSEFRGGVSRHVRYLYRRGGRWSRGYGWVSDPVCDRGFLAVPASAL